MVRNNQENGGHVGPNVIAEYTTQSNEPQSVVMEGVSGDPSEKPLSRRATGVYDENDDPFALFPTLSITMSSTRGHGNRRGTVSTLGRPLTRQETLQTIKTVRSRFTDARSEFDENVFLIPRWVLTSRMTYLNLPQLMKILLRLMVLKIL